MGDTYFVRVDENDGKRLVLSVLTGTAGGLADFAYSRSFVLNALHDMVQRAVDVSLQSGSHRPGSSLTGDRVVPMLPRIKALEGKAALQKAIPELGHSEEWFRENVGTYVVSTKLLRRYNAHENKIRERVRAFETLKLGPFEWRDRMWLAGAQLHHRGGAHGREVGRPRAQGLGDRDVGLRLVVWGPSVDGS